MTDYIRGTNFIETSATQHRLAEIEALRLNQSPKELQQALKEKILEVERLKKENADLKSQLSNSVVACPPFGA